MSINSLLMDIYPAQESVGVMTNNATALELYMDTGKMGIALEECYIRLDLCNEIMALESITSPTSLIVTAMESTLAPFTIDSVSNEGFLESVKNTAKAIWDAILNITKKIVSNIVKFFKWITGNGKKTDKTLKEAAGAVKKAKVSETAESVAETTKMKERSAAVKTATDAVEANAKAAKATADILDALDEDNFDIAGVEDAIEKANANAAANSAELKEIMAEIAEEENTKSVTPGTVEAATVLNSATMDAADCTKYVEENAVVLERMRKTIEKLTSKFGNDKEALVAINSLDKVVRGLAKDNNTTVMSTIALAKKAKGWVDAFADTASMLSSSVNLKFGKLKPFMVRVGNHTDTNGATVSLGYVVGKRPLNSAVVAVHSGLGYGMEIPRTSSVKTKFVKYSVDAVVSNPDMWADAVSILPSTDMVKLVNDIKLYKENLRSDKEVKDAFDWLRKEMVKLK